MKTVTSLTVFFNLPEAHLEHRRCIADWGWAREMGRGVAKARASDMREETLTDASWRCLAFISLRMQMTPTKPALLVCLLTASLSPFQSVEVSNRLPSIERIRWKSPATIRGGSDAADDEHLFHELLDLSGSNTTLRLRQGERGRGLFTKALQRKGDTLLTIPLQSCLRESEITFLRMDLGCCE
eukprot:762128-Hanusia_phi.AAC.8